MAHRQYAATPPRDLDQSITLRERRRQRLLEQDILAPLQRGDADLGVKVVRNDDVHDVDVRARQQLAVTEIHLGVREVLASGGRRRLAAARDRHEGGSGCLGDRLRVVAAPESVADQPEAHHPFSAPATRPRTTYFCSSSTSTTVGASPSRQMAIISVKNTK